MPNWCDCTYKCVGDLKEVKAIYKVLKSLDKRKTSIIENGFGKNVAWQSCYQTWR